MTIESWRGDAAFADVNAFADLYQRMPAMAGAVREAATHPSGPAVLLKRSFTSSDGVPEQQVAALFVTNGVGTVLLTRAPTERWPQYAPTFQHIFQRFVPG